MNTKNHFLFNNVQNPDHWRISEIILDQCKKHSKREIIDFIDGPNWTFHDLKIKSLVSSVISKTSSTRYKPEYLLAFIELILIFAYQYFLWIQTLL